MKRFATFMLLAVLSVASSAMPSSAQQISPEQNARQSRKANKKQQKMLNKANKKQKKAMKRAAKSQRKANKKANRQHR